MSKTVAIGLHQTEIFHLQRKAIFLAKIDISAFQDPQAIFFLQVWSAPLISNFEVVQLRHLGYRQTHAHL